MNSNPRARRNDLIIETMDDELLLYDTTRAEAHVLNHAAAFVWQQSDGTRSVEEIARAMAHTFGAATDAQVVHYALTQLDKKNLLQDAVRAPIELQGLTRRQFLKQSAAAAALLAVVTTLAAPTPAQAQSACVNPISCTTDTECCPGFVCCFPSNPKCNPGC